MYSICLIVSDNIQPITYNNALFFHCQEFRTVNVTVHGDEDQVNSLFFSFKQTDKHTNWQKDKKDKRQQNKKRQNDNDGDCDCDCARWRRPGQLTILLILAHFLLHVIQCRPIMQTYFCEYFWYSNITETFYFISNGNGWIQTGIFNIHKQHPHKKPSLQFKNILASEREKNNPCRSSSVQPSQIMRTSCQPSPLLSPTKRWLFQWKTR